MSAPSAEETKEERFKRLAQSRVNRAVKDIRLIGNLSNTSTYDFTPEQVRKIAAALRTEVAAMRRRFDDALADNSGGFRL